MSTTIKVNDSTPQSLLISFPQGIPWNLEDSMISMKENSLKRKRMVVASLNDIEYSGCNFGEDSFKNDVCKYVIGVLDEKSGKLEIIPMDHPYSLRPNIKIASNIRTQSTTLSNYERKQSLTDAFGSKKKKRAQKSVASNTILTENISGSNAIEVAMKTIIDDPIEQGTKKFMDAAEKALEINRIQLLPSFNTDTLDVEDAYPLTSLIPDPIIASIRDTYDSFMVDYDESESSIAEYWAQYFNDDDSPQIVIYL